MQDSLEDFEEKPDVAGKGATALMYALGVIALGLLAYRAVQVYFLLRFNQI